ncbi:MAG: rhodanese-like domain-containing protein, partial [Candidatus Thermoplasmatota archaeon]|nr:rhodanese-like domain-containing protein [Candidatus Thermoplasmatota archaeon]
MRTPEEFSGEHIEGAKNINFFSTDFEKQLKN